jgi:hypothetical protein
MSGSETQTPTNDTTDAGPAPGVETPAAPATGAPDSSSDSSTPPSSGSDSSASPSSGDSRQSDRDELLAAIRKVVPTSPEAPFVPSDQTSDADKAPATGQDKDKAAAPGTSETQTPAEPSPSQTSTTSTELLPDPTEADLRKLRPETRRRVEQLLSQRNDARRALEQVQPELNQHRQLQGYLQSNQLAPDDVNITLGLLSVLRRGDYQGFLTGVMPYVMAAQEAVGQRVAPDLQKQVDDGLVSEEAARELTRTRHRATQAEARLQEQSRAAAAAQQDRSVMAIRQAVDSWEANVRSRDPDYAYKADAVRRFSQALLQERGIPQTAEQAVALTQAAYDEASRVLARMRPQPQPTRPTPSGIHVAAVNGAAAAEPRSMREAVLLALQHTRARAS